MILFNPEHDLCLANGDANYAPPESAMKFGKDCSRIMDIIVPACRRSRFATAPSLWGWNLVARNRLLKAGRSTGELPTVAQIEKIRQLSHRRHAIAASQYISSAMQKGDFVAEELFDTESIERFVDSYGEVVLKAPWSGSGKGLRWISRDTFSDSDRGWCKKVIAKQGSVIGERRVEVVENFALLFYIGDEVDFVGYSLFRCENGAYKSNVLASDMHILDVLSKYVDVIEIEESKRALTEYLTENFLGHYEGYLGVDAFIYLNGDGYTLRPCIEINVRMTMGLVARIYYNLNKKSAPVIGTDSMILEDGKFRMEVVYSSDNNFLREMLNSAVRVLTPVLSDTQYAIAIFRL